MSTPRPAQPPGRKKRSLDTSNAEGSIEETQGATHTKVSKRRKVKTKAFKTTQKPVAGAEDEEVPAPESVLRHTTTDRNLVADVDDIDGARANSSLAEHGRGLLDKEDDAAVYLDRNLSAVAKFEKALQASHERNHRMPAVQAAKHEGVTAVKSKKPGPPKKERKKKSAAVDDPPTPALELNAEKRDPAQDASLNTSSTSGGLDPVQDVPPLPPSMSESFASPPKGSKIRWRVLMNPPKRKGAHRLAFRKNRGGAEVFLVDANDPKIKISFTLRSQAHVDVQNTDNALRIMENVANFYNSVAGVPKDGPTVKHMITSVAISVAFPTALRIRAPVWNKHKGFCTSIDYYDTDTNDYGRYGHETYTGAGDISNIPDVPGSGELWHFAGAKNRIGLVGKDDQGHHLSLLPTDRNVLEDRVFTKYNGKTHKKPTIEELLAREKFERFLSWKLSGIMATHAQISTAVRDYANLYCIAGITKSPPKPPQGSKSPKASYASIIGIRRLTDAWSRAMMLKAGPLLCDGLGFKPPPVKLRSVDFRWVAPIVEATMRTWRETVDARATWMQVSAMADSTNAELMAGNLPLHSCYCAEEMRDDVTHMCGGCGRETPCRKLSKNMWGISMCEACRDKFSKNKWLGTRMNELLIRAGLERRLKKEAAYMGRGFKDALIQEVYEEGVTSITRNMGECAVDEWKDAYTGIKRMIGPNFNPHSPSVEAIDAFTCRPAKDGSLQTWVHAHPNLAMIAHPLNIEKSNFPVSSLAAVSTHVVDSEHTSPNQKTELVKALMDRLAEQRLVGLRYAVSRETRLNRSFTREEFDVATAEFRTGRLSTGTGTDLTALISSTYYVFADKRKCAWNNEQKSGIVQVCDDIEVEKGASIPRSLIDGAPWLIPHETMPNEWDWHQLYSVIRERHLRMENVCNKYWSSKRQRDMLCFMSFC